MMVYEAATFVACRFPAAGAKCITGDIYPKDEREAVKHLYEKRKIQTVKQCIHPDDVHIYPVMDYDGQLKLSNWDHEFNPMSAGELTQEGIDRIVFYFVTEQYLEPMFGMDVDGDDIMLVKQEDWGKFGLTDADVDAVRKQEIEKRRDRFNKLHEYMLHKCRLPAYISNAMDLAAESGLVVQPEGRV